MSSPFSIYFRLHISHLVIYLFHRYTLTHSMRVEHTHERPWSSASVQLYVIILIRGARARSSHSNAFAVSLFAFSRQFRNGRWMGNHRHTWPPHQINSRAMLPLRYKSGILKSKLEKSVPVGPTLGDRFAQYVARIAAAIPMAFESSVCRKSSVRSMSIPRRYRTPATEGKTVYKQRVICNYPPTGTAG